MDAQRGKWRAAELFCGHVVVRQGCGAGACGVAVFLAEMYDKGHGVPQDYAQAAAWYLKAARKARRWRNTGSG